MDSTHSSWAGCLMGSDSMVDIQIKDFYRQTLTSVGVIVMPLMGSEIAFTIITCLTPSLGLSDATKGVLKSQTTHESLGISGMTPLMAVSDIIIILEADLYTTVTC